MLTHLCVAWPHFVSLQKDGPKIFGFAEFLTALALLVLAWTVGDFQYRFRAWIAPVPLRPLTFGMMVSVGALTLLTDLWRAQGWLVPEGHLFSPASWQALLGAAFLITFLTWGWYAFIRPSIFGKKNAKRYAQILYSVILKGSPSEIPVIAGEIAFSAKSIVNASWLKNEWNDDGARSREKDKFRLQQWKRKRHLLTKDLAYEILLLIANRKFCRHVVESSPGTAFQIFRAILDSGKYDVPIGAFAKNITSEAILNKDSFLFHESSGYDSGLLGYHKPLTQTLYGNYQMVEQVEMFFDIDYREIEKWDSDQWLAYTRIILITFRDYVATNQGGRALVFWRSFEIIIQSTSDMYELDKLDSDYWLRPQFKKLRMSTDFAKEVLSILKNRPVPANFHLREKRDINSVSIYDLVVRHLSKIIFHASYVREPRTLCWSVQYNAVWGNIFNSSVQQTKATKFIKHKLRRALYNDVAGMTKFPNFVGSRIIGFLLNVLGLDLLKDDRHRDFFALHKATLSWIKKNFAKLYIYNSIVAETCLVAWFEYDKENQRIIFNKPADGLMRAYQAVLQLDPPSVSSIPDPE